MTRSFLSLFTGLLFITAGSLTAAGQQTFTLSGHIDGLQIGDTLRFQRTIIYPKWQCEEAFDILIQQAKCILIVQQGQITQPLATTTQRDVKLIIFLFLINNLLLSFNSSHNDTFFKVFRL